MKYVWVGVLVAVVVGAEVFHELGRGDVPGAAVCAAPEAQHEALRDLLAQHLRSH